MRKLRITYAGVAGASAILIAISGSAFAALTITSRDIVNGSIRTKDLHADSVGTVQARDGSLIVADLDNAIRLGTGASLALEDVAISISESVSLSSGPVIASLVLPRGRFLVSGTVAISGTRSIQCFEDPQTQTGYCDNYRIGLYCRTGVGEGQVEQIVQVFLHKDYEDEVILPIDLEVMSAGSVSVDLRCAISKAPGASGSASATQVRMNAVEVM